jgi:hypothetical protein
MATYTGQCTLNTNDSGNLASYQYFYDDTYTPNTPGLGGTLTDFLDNMVGDMLSTMGGNVTYTISNGTDWGDAVTINFTFANPDFEVYFAYIQTEEYYYAIHITTSTECLNAHEVILTACEGNYVIPSGLTPLTNYYFSLETQRNKRYVQEISTDANGDVQLWANAPEFPTGFFTPEMMTMTGKVYTDSALTNQQQFTINNTLYNSLNIKFIYTIITSN